MKKMNKKGFTLIELLAVIVILGVVMSIAVVSYNNQIASSKKEGFAKSTQSYFSAAKDKFMMAGSLYADGSYYIDISEIELNNGGKSPYNGKDYKGYISVTTSGSTISSGKITNTYSICITDEQNGINLSNVKVSDNISSGKVKALGSCAAPSGTKVS